VQVAFAAGFESVRRFNALFRNHYRLTPSTLRRSSSKTASADCLRLVLANRPPLAWEALLRFLAGRQAPTVAFIPGMDERSRRRFSSPTLRLESKPLDVRRAARECDAAVLNGNGGTAAAAVLLAGRPSLHFPLYFEHAVNARCVERLGAGRSCAPGDPSKAVENLRDFLGSDAYTVGAEAFARRYAAFDANRQHEEMLGALLKVIEKGQPGG